SGTSPKKILWTAHWAPTSDHSRPPQLNRVHRSFVRCAARPHRNVESETVGADGYTRTAGLPPGKNSQHLLADTEAGEDRAQQVVCRVLASDPGQRKLAETQLVRRKLGNLHRRSCPLRVLERRPQRFQVALPSQKNPLGHWLRAGCAHDGVLQQIDPV